MKKDYIVFLENEYGALMGPVDSFLVLTQYRDGIWNWCRDNNISLWYHGTLNIYDLWNVTHCDNKTKMWTKLKWE
jgi:hypothetical protein